jgi:tRNA (guanine-N7-)-methyltransferase
MSFGLARGKTLDPGSVGRVGSDFPPLPDDPACLDAARIDPRAWFDEPDRPFELEIGSGKGTFLIQAARARHSVNFLGIEWAHEFWLYAADRCRRHSLDNVKLLHADATEFLRWRAPDAFVDVLHLYFSDPWPKKRHHKRRVVTDRFLEETHRVLKPGAQLRIVTDHDDYWQWMEEHFNRVCQGGAKALRFERLEEAAAKEVIRIAPPDDGDGEGDAPLVGTNYERKFAREGRNFHAAVLVRPADDAPPASSNH